jgi:diguanylate cyclase (GGDEF)-like protein
MMLLLPTIAAQTDLLGSAVGILVSVVASFLVITVVASYYRFQHIVELADKTQPEELGSTASEILRVQLARYLAGCARRGTSFSLSLIHVGNAPVEVRMGSPLVEAIKQAARIDDITCVYDDSTAVLLTEAEPEDSEAILTRISETVAANFSTVALEELRVGMASYPGHGLSGKDLLQVAQSGLEEANLEKPVVLPEIIDVDAEEDDEDHEEGSSVAEVDDVGSSPSGGSLRERRKSHMLDELTGVLKPSAVSAYMQRMMNDLRREKKPAALFCVGVNNIENISRIHGVGAADHVMAGISAVLQENLRADDLIGRHEKYAFLVLSQASVEEAEIIGKRINTLVQQSEFVSGSKKLKTTITLGVATYPEHGRNLHHLYTAGQKVLDYSRMNDIRAYAVYDPEIHDRVPSKPMKSIKSIQA